MKRKIDIKKILKELYNRNLKEGNINRKGDCIGEEHLTSQLCPYCLRTHYNSYSRDSIFDYHIHHPECYGKINKELIEFLAKEYYKIKLDNQFLNWIKLPKVLDRRYYLNKKEFALK